MDESHISLITKLQQNGLSEKEAQVYFYLLRLGPSAIGTLNEYVPQHKQTLYNTLQSLQQKNLVNAQKAQGTPTTFQAASPHVFLEQNMIERTMLEALVPELEVQQGSARTIGGVEVISGLIPFQTYFEQRLRRIPQGSVVDILGAGGDQVLHFLKQRSFFRLYENIRVDRKISHRLLMYANQQTVNREYIDRRYIEHRFLQSDFIGTPLPVIIWPDSIALLVFPEKNFKIAEPQILHIAGSSLRKGYSSHFTALWALADKKNITAQ